MWPSPYEYMDRLKTEYKGGFGRMERKMEERDTRMLVALVATASAGVTILSLVLFYRLKAVNVTGGLSPER